MICLGIPAARAQNIVFPPPAADAASAAAGFDERARAIVAYNACGRELDYSALRKEMAGGEYENQGEGFTGILIAKIAWLTDPRYVHSPCEHEMIVPRPKLDDGTFAYPSLQDFVNDKLGAWGDPATPTRCSAGTSLVVPREDQMTIKFKVDRACLKQQVNEGIRAMEKTSQMGTDGLHCVENDPTLISGAIARKGDFDVVVRDVVRILSMGTRPRQEVLEPETVTHMYGHLLAARGPVSPAEYSMVSDCHDPAGDELGTPEDYADRESWYNEALQTLSDIFKWLFNLPIRLLVTGLVSGVSLGIAPFLLAAGVDPTQLILPHWDITVGETENHRLMIETSKYLTNAAIIRELKRIDHDNVSDIEEYQTGVRNWLLHTLQQIAVHDFSEYNARPYTRYSLNAILNLYEFAEDPALRTASQIVLDLSAAKFAAANNRGRRVVPFRRLSEYDAKGLYEFVQGSDHEVVRSVVLSGQTQLLPLGIDREGAKSMVYPAVSSYRLPAAVQETAVDRHKGPFAQEIRHTSVEGYFSSPSFTMSLGGVRTPAALNFYGNERGVDRGVAMPTCIIPTIGGWTPEDLFSFAGIGKEDERSSNICGWKGFICGVNPRFSAFLSCAFAGGETTSSGPDFSFFNTARCPGQTPGRNFYLASMTRRCGGATCGEGRDWGLMEAVEAPNAVPGNDAFFEGFRQRRRAAMAASNVDASGIGTYESASGDLIQYQIQPGLASVLAINGSPRPAFATKGQVLNSDGAGKVFITSPFTSSRVEIDFTDVNNPKRAAFPP
ncbi:MAG: hypothetical protein ABJC61_02720 [Acidobacteriota bacterium]